MTKLKGGIPIDEFMKNQLDVVKQLKVLCEGNNEIIEDIISITKNINTRLSALDITVRCIEKNRVATDSEKASFLELINNLQEQVDAIAKAIYTKEK